MIRRVISVGRWVVEVLIFPDAYSEDIILYKLDEYGASDAAVSKIHRLMRNGKKNTGFTYASAKTLTALVVIGPFSSSKQFLNTISHEIHHLAVAVAENLGVELDSEAPAYITGDATQDLLDVICGFGCDCHNGQERIC